MSVAYENITFLCGKDPPYYTHIVGIAVDWVIFLIGLPEVCMAFYALLVLLRKDKAAPIFAINLLLSDLLQIAITVVFIVSRFFPDADYPLMLARCVTRLFVRVGLCSSLGFMLLISAERYVLIACPVWYRASNSWKLPTLVSVGLWLLTLTYSTLDYVLLVHAGLSLLLFSFLTLLPAPFLALFYMATWKALRENTTSTRLEGRIRRNVLGSHALVLGIYTVLFLPYTFRNLFYFFKYGNDTNVEDPVRDLSSVWTSALVYLSPLTDPFLYIFMRKDIKDTVDAFPCCKRLLVKASVFSSGLVETSQGGSSDVIDRVSALL